MVRNLRAFDGGRGELLRVRDVAELLQFSTATVYGLIDSGELPHHRLGNHAIRVHRDDVASYLSRNRTGRV